MKKQLAITLAALMAVGLAGCGGSSSSTSSESTAAAGSASSAAESTAASSTSASSAAADEDIAIGCIVKTTTSEYWSYVIAGCEAAGKDLGIKVDIVGPQSETSYDEQNSEIENYISSGQYDALALAALQPDSVGKVLGDPGIPVVMFDNDAESDAKVAYVGCGNVNASYEGGKYALEQAGDVKNVVLIGGVQGNPSSTLREEGFGKAIEEAGLELAAMQYADWTADKAAQVMENIITSLNGDIDLVFCCNDDMASGAAKALKQAGLLEDVYLCGFDGIQSGVESVISGDQDLTIAQEPYQVGYTAVETAYKAAKGETVEENIDTGFKLITPDNAEDYLANLKELVG